MPDDLIKQAFLAIKQDIFQLSNQISILNQELQQLQAQNNLINSFIQDTKSLFDSIQNQQKALQDTNNLTQNSLKISQNHLKIAENALKEHISAHKAQNPTIQHITPTLPTDDLAYQALKQPNMLISIGNEGVPTNKQTNQQTDKYPLFAHGKTSKNAKNINFEQKYDENPENLLKIASGVYSKPQQIPPKIQPIQIETPDKDQLSNASELLENLDSLKKEIRRKFKALTPQEFKVFTAIYQLEEQHLTVDYTLLSKKLKLSESSIRDYIGRIISKGVPIIKEKINNKQVIVHISADLKKIASLAAILQLREL